MLVILIDDSSLWVWEGKHVCLLHGIVTLLVAILCRALNLEDRGWVLQCPLQTSCFCSVLKDSLKCGICYSCLKSLTNLMNCLFDFMDVVAIYLELVYTNLCNVGLLVISIFRWSCWTLMLSWWWTPDLCRRLLITIVCIEMRYIIL